ncbi:MAG TPA: isoprenylcysteine carboxylmethyltransferase family protein [Acidobacteriaceae bacterium]|jgi:protein-S-isoprenylcysteine O-methyltransferase Ste14|nr:isoprenylcysteine carboxylmethyltransferase family protein [Acidobacteriaceae bacterium]
MKANILSLTLILVALCFFVPQFLRQPWGPLRIAGAVVAVASLSLIVTARIQLGRSFSVRARATRLVTSGLYARIRNPIYIFGCFFFLGLAMFIPAWWLLLALVIVIPMQIVRARREATILEATFGDEYRRYRQQTWF